MRLKLLLQALVLLIAVCSVILYIAAPHDWQAQSDAFWARHYYSQQKNGTYIYDEGREEAAPDNDARTPLRVQYKGIQNGRVTLTFQYPESRWHGVITCDVECQFVDVQLFDDDLLITHSTIRITNDPLIFGMVHDALGGKLLMR
jgi:hypothetical protein